jgi:hypothetical protein
MLSAYTPDGASNPTVNNIVIKGIKFACNSLAGTAINGLSLAFCTFEDLNVYEPTVRAFYCGCQPQTEVTSFRRCTFKRITVRCLAVAARPAHGMVTDGNANGNFSFNTVEDFQVIHYDGDGIRIIDGDNNLFLSTYTFRAGGGSGFGVSLHGATTAGLAARSNHFIHLTANGGVKAYGTTTYAAPSIQNNIWFYDRENGCPNPTVETGATLFLHNDKGSFEKIACQQAVFATSQASLDAQRALMGTESLRIHHGGNNHVILTDGTSTWGINIESSTGNIRIVRSAGSGSIDLGAGAVDVAIHGHKVTHGIVAPTTGAWLVGDRCWHQAPAVGSPKGWLCTVSGTPGTWVSEGNL